jgi:HEAT repeat protein
LVKGPVTAFRRYQVGVRTAKMRRRLQDLASGKVTESQVTLEESGVDVAGVIDEVTRGLRADSMPVQRLVTWFWNSGAIDHLADRLESRSIPVRIAAAHTVGALHLYEAVWYLEPLLASRDRHVSDASARALGRIGGTHSATALMRGIQRRGTNRRLVAELARSAPDQFIESAISEAAKPGVRPALALAAGLRRRRTATSQLIRLVQRGSMRERVISCRALGWIGATIAIPLLIEALNDRNWKLRMSATKALGALRATESVQELRQLMIDRNPRVRRAAQQALLRIEAARGA